MTTLLHSIGTVIGPLNVDLVLRLLLTLVLCGLVGLERSTHERASGFRPHILVGLGACLMTLAGAHGFSGIPGTTHDPTRIASYVVSGTGFLGAGAILRHGTTVRGITTAATLWGVAGIGIAVGAGLGGLAAVTVLLVLFTLRPLKVLEAHLRLGRATNELTITLTDDQRAVGKTLAALKRLDVPVGPASLQPATPAELSVTYMTRLFCAIWRKRTPRNWSIPPRRPMAWPVPEASLGGSSVSPASCW